MGSKPDNPDLWLEPLTPEKHMQDFHEICADEQAAQWSTLRHTDSFESSKALMEKAFMHTANKPWFINRAVMSSNYPSPNSDGTKMVGIVKTVRASHWGLSIGYKLRSDCWGKGYATRAVQMLLDEFWSQPRRAPRREVYAARKQEEGVADDDEDIEITHLIAQVDAENRGSMRVSEKCGGKVVTICEKSVKVWRFDEKRDMAVWRFDKPPVVPPSA
ncbi:hypothetical protein CkaCkLH20_02963 [Colletotrichum karsti]|uniref:N-acetyltransferase domain-containing protein n=1 Tax=Colletotrichum karsti TaxID=1095194 RepID=A0A9P6LNC9_9PEZI|nr:uncharacterized protein CkaCkLH20_02963 [Colletotrichum karsti]KAF9879420.1 hypothetical protein CkaCkLH20_02963 [Colletotrichum karsti]